MKSHDLQCFIVTQFLPTSFFQISKPSAVCHPRRRWTHHRGQRFTPTATATLWRHQLWPGAMATCPCRRSGACDVNFLLGLQSTRCAVKPSVDVEDSLVEMGNLFAAQEHGFFRYGCCLGEEKQLVMTWMCIPGSHWAIVCINHIIHIISIYG